MPNNTPKSKSKPKGVGEGSFGYLTQILTRRVEAQLKERLQEVGIDLRVFSNLLMLSDQDGINQRQLGEKLGFPEYHVSRNVDALIQAGLARRQIDPKNRRSTLVFLTEKGRDIALKLPKIVNDVNGGFLDPLEKEERTLLIRLLQKTAGL